MTQVLESKVISRVYGKGKGWAFSQNDFSDLGRADSVRKALSRLEHGSQDNEDKKG